MIKKWSKFEEYDLAKAQIQEPGGRLRGANFINRLLYQLCDKLTLDNIASTFYEATHRSNNKENSRLLGRQQAESRHSHSSRQPAMKFVLPAIMEQMR